MSVRNHVMSKKKGSLNTTKRGYMMDRLPLLFPKIEQEKYTEIGEYSQEKPDHPKEVLDDGQALLFSEETKQYKYTTKRKPDYPLDQIKDNRVFPEGTNVLRLNNRRI